MGHVESGTIHLGLGRWVDVMRPTMVWLSKNPHGWRRDAQTPAGHSERDIYQLGLKRRSIWFSTQEWLAIAYY